jgi:checkpoint serine/threonine-protein kinase
LEVWVRFIKWAEQTFTSGGRETEVLPLLERCTRELRETRFEQYRDDARYLRVWVKYADLCKEPHDIFKFLQANDIGQRHTLFYEAYAAFLEIKGAYGKAAETYDRGVVMRAQPRDRLKDKLAQFQHRMMRREQRKAENRANGVEDDTGEIAETAARRFGDARAGAGRSAEAENPGGAARGVVGGGVAGTVGAPPVGAGGSKRGRGMRGAAAAAAAAASGSANAEDGGLEVYCDDENGAPEAPAGEWRNLPAYQETRKENSRAATAWAGQRLKQKRSRPGQAGAPPPGPTLEVYHDEDLVLAEDMAAADAAAAAREARKNANALRRRLDAGGAGESSAGLATDPMLYHKQGAPPPQRPRAQERLYSPFVPSDTTDERGAEVSYEETRARGWMRARATSAAPALAPAPGPIVPDPRAFATSTATTDPVLAAPPRAPSESPRSRPPLARRDATPASGGSCDAPPSDAGSGVEGCGREPRTDEARGSGLAPVDPGAAPPAAAAVPAGLRWTATEGGTYGAEPTMTLCTKEAWGDIMSMFSDGAPKAARPPEPAPAADPPALREATERAARDIGTLEIREDTQFGFGGLDVREDTQFGGLEIREDTVVLPAAPPPPRDPAARAPLAPRAPARPAPAVSAGQNSAAPPVESSDGALDVYQDTALLDAAAVAAAAGVGSHGSAPLGERRLPDGWRAASAGEPSANGPDEFEVYEDERHAEMENAPPSGHQPAVRDFVPRSIADAAAAAAALQPLPLDLRSEAAGDEEMDDAEREDAEAAMRNARPPVELRGDDDFQVYADADDETAAVPKVR